MGERLTRPSRLQKETFNVTYRYRCPTAARANNLRSYEQLSQTLAIPEDAGSLFLCES